MNQSTYVDDMFSTRPMALACSVSSSSSSAGSDASASSPRCSTSSLIDFSDPSTNAKLNTLESELAHIEQGLSSTTSRESLLDELLGDIRRSCATSVSSTPSLAASEGEGEANVFDCKLRRSEAELRTLSECCCYGYCVYSAGEHEYRLAKVYVLPLRLYWSLT